MSGFLKCFERVLKRLAARRRDKNIAKLGQEYRDLIFTSPYSTARLCQIISELGRLWNDKMRDEWNEELAERDGARDIEQLQKAVGKIVCEGKKKMAKARGKEEISLAFIEGVDKMRRLLDE